MKARIVRIGNSQGIRIPRPLLAQAGLSDEVELKLGDGKLIIEAARKPRAGWEEAFRAMAKRGDDQLLDVGSLVNSWDEESWEW